MYFLECQLTVVVKLEIAAHGVEQHHVLGKGLSNERGSFELSLLEKHLAQGEQITDDVFEEAKKQGDAYASGLTRQQEQQEEAELKARYASAAAEFQRKKDTAKWRPGSQYHIRLHPDDFPHEGTDSHRPIAEYIRSCLNQLGVPTENLKIRMFTADRVPIALASGTDRDFNSNTHHIDGVEPKLMRIFGIYSARDVTYVSDLERWSGPSKINRGLTDAIIVYQGDQLYKIGYESNGFSAFLTSPHAAVVAIFSPQGLPISEITPQRIPPSSPPAPGQQG